MITLELPPDLEARFLAEANAKGVSIGEVVKAYLCHTSVEGHQKSLSAEEVDNYLQEAATRGRRPDPGRNSAALR